ncbi:GNAT family N-acetyltransferase [Clostridium botulinum]|uniref:Acetyltransferase n=1 Tax=Clostridium botulinum CFSAN001627 TaxID=1232189 RepID=M1ZRI9_CLOBO|nr:GNAT family protein [Clostridium botulinum]EKN37670.1 acetyltransferase [Clostridium botulinum CFSAN001627]APC78965.1 acetyltransferase domain protein [Clostridium botulinum]APC82409.1 acetyltransferase domain protein [Clostridium botulinum]APQ75533.1 acetyltransferase domain protein [Clostridium botulinum]AUM98334.1 N-acetyltransferase [Clostridium botulinum]
MNSNEINISTERLILRGIKASDAESMFKYRSNPQIYKFQSWKPQTLEEVKEFICEKTAKIPNIPDTWYQLGILLKETDELVGDIGIHFIDSDNLQAEIGFTLSLGHQCKGYATEAIIGVINYLFNNLKKHRIIASVDPRNIKSIALLERIQMRKEAHFKKSFWFNNEWTDDVVYAILKEEWDNEKVKRNNE